MLKKVMVAGSLFLVVLIGCFFIFSHGEKVIHNQSEKLVLNKKLENKVTNPVLDQINTRNSQIVNISCSLKTIAQMPGKRPAKLNGSLDYEKQKKFRLSLDSFIGPELDIGSDGNQFWFWAGRMKDPGLYWSTYENFSKTRLKTPFNPLWLSHCLGIDIIDYSDATIDKSGDRWRVLKKTKNAKGEDITAVIYVDPNKVLITGHGMYNKDGVLEASSEIQEFNGVLPAKITFVWHKEDASMIWNLTNVRSNVGISSNRWVMPNIKPKIDMSRE